MRNRLLYSKIARVVDSGARELTEVSDWDSQDLLNNFMDCLPIYLSDDIDEPGPEDAKTAFIVTPVLLEELLARHEKCHSNLYCDILNLPRSSTYAQIADFLKNSNSAEVSLLVNLIAIVRDYEKMQQVDVSHLSAEAKKEHFHRLEDQRQVVQAILETAGTAVID